LAWSTAATLPVAVAVCEAGLALSDLALSDNVACWAAWACARADSIEAGVNSTSAANAGTASDVIRQKGQ
jgi:hypothetical protein